MTQSPNRFALKATSGLATVLATLSSSQLSAATDDPFALPGKDFRVPDKIRAADDPFAIAPNSPISSQRADAYVFYADVVLNGTNLDGIAKVKNIDGELAIESGFAFAKGITATFPKSEFVTLSTIAGLTFTFDTQTYRLTLIKDLKSTGPNLIDLSQRSKRTTAASEHVAAFIVDYDASVQADRNGLRATGLFAPRFSKGDSTLEASIRLSSDKGTTGRRITRLDTFFEQRLPHSATSVTIGDFVSQVPTGARAVRMGGVQIGTDFELRPDLVTQPLPDFVGSVAVPTAIDVLVNDRRVTSREVERGEFTVQSVPVPVGRSEVGAVVRDALGRETIISVPFYSARRLLAKGLFEGALNIGAIRRRFGVRSNDYGPLALSAMARKGLSNTFTVTGLAEASNGIANAGLGADMVIANAALLNLTARASHDNNGPFGVRSGYLLEAGVESAGPVFSASLDMRKVSRGYSDVASASGDAPPPSQLAANISFDLAKHGRMQLSAIRQSNPDRPWRGQFANTTTLVSGSYRRRLGRRAGLSFDVTRRVSGNRTDWRGLLGVSITLGGRSFAQASYQHGQGSGEFQASVARPAIEPGEYGYSAAVGLGRVERVSGSISRQMHWGRLEAQSEMVDGYVAGRINARGALIAAGGNVFAARGGSGSYLLVDSGGIGGIEVERENRKSGLTNERGQLLIDRVPSYNVSKVGVDPAELPTSVIARSVEEYVSVSPRAVAKVSLQLERYQPKRIRLTDQRGIEFKPGTRLIALPSNTRYLVGHGSLIEINLAAEDTRLKVVAPNGTICHADLADIEVDPDRRSAPGQLQCYMKTRSFAIGEVRPD
jgi:outer membrane usher protein FimD/PapC